jgi:hypothetical protein
VRRNSHWLPENALILKKLWWLHVLVEHAFVLKERRRWNTLGPGASIPEQEAKGWRLIDVGFQPQALILVDASLELVRFSQQCAVVEPLRGRMLGECG